MATLTITISNRLGLYAVEPTNEWGQMVWGTDTWGWRDVEWQFKKAIAEAITLSSVNGFSVHKLLADSLTFDTAISRQFPYRIFETMGLSSAITIVKVINNGWTLAKGEQENALDWPMSSFSLISDPTTTWSEVLNPTTTWVQQ